MTDAPLITPRGVMDWTRDKALSAVLEPCACCRGIKSIQPYEAWGMLCNGCATAVGEDPWL